MLGSVANSLGFAGILTGPAGNWEKLRICWENLGFAAKNLGLAGKNLGFTIKKLGTC